MSDKKDKIKDIRTIFVLVIGLNLLLFLIKYIPIYFFNSVTVEAEAFHSLADLVYTVVLFVGAHFAFLPKDESHPHGHDRMRPFLSLIVAASVFYTGVVIIQDAFASLLYGSSWNFTPIFFIALLTSGIAKFLTSKYLEVRGESLNSEVIKSISKDYRADSIANISAIIGVTGAFLGFVVLDPLFGLFISAWIFKTAYDIGKKNFDFLTGAAPSDKVEDQIREKIKSDDVIQINEIEAHYVGPKIHVYSEVVFPGELSFKEVHKKEEKIKRAIEELEKVDTAYIHIEPSD